MQDPIYLDHNATTPVAPEVIEAMLPALRDGWGNPSSVHVYGMRARQAVDRARGQLAELLGCDAEEILFTCGGTESDNAAIVGLAEARAERGRHIVISAIEHPAVERACAYLETRGWSVTRIGVDRDGRVTAGEFEAALRADTVLVSLMHSNNETGVLQPVREVARAARARGIVVHSDAAQSVGKLPLDVEELGVDLLSLAGHKLYAPKGVGALYVRTATPLAPYLKGAGHEGGRRAGTENTPGIVGLGAACALAQREKHERPEHLSALRDRLERVLRESLPELVVHGGRVPRLPNTLSAALPGCDATALVAGLEGVATAAGAACHSGKAEASHVLRAMGIDDAIAVATLRLSLGRSNTAEQIDRAAGEIVRAHRGQT